jgi:hypothetical protein
MPIQKSSVNRAITPAEFEAPFESTFTRFGLKGLNINDAVDAIEPDELSRMLNLTHRVDASVTSRDGQTNITGTAVGTNHHSIRRLNDPENSTYTRVQGVDTSLYVGQGTLTSVDSGYSGKPLHLVPYHPPFSNQPWMYVADSSRMRKVRADGLDLPIGLPAPSNAATSALGTINTTTIAALTTGSPTDPNNWTPNSGFTFDEPPVAVVAEILSPVTDDTGAAAIHFGGRIVGTTPTGYSVFFGVPTTIDMSKVGTLTASDDDYIHLKMSISHTQFVKEFRIYLVCSPLFTPSVLPGTAGTVNGDSYMKAFSANDFSSYIQAQQTQFDASELARIRALRDNVLQQEQGTTGQQRDVMAKVNANLNTVLASGEQTRTITVQSSAASDTWQEFGIVSIPVRRGDFQRLGQTAGRDWSNITGIICYLQTGPSGNVPCGTTAVTISQLRMYGGVDLDSGEAADSPYDYRYTHYDTRTGTEGNPSPVMPSTSYLDALRTSINITPTAYGDGSVHQRFYRRGGTLPTDWFFVGQNASDGGVFNDTIGDLEASTSGSVDTDNDQPVSTVDNSGTTILDQPVYALWGPLQDLLFACGDPHRPGHVYYCKPGNPDSWPPDFITEVSGPGEQLMTGCLYGGQSFVFSSERAFVLYPNFGGDSVSVTSTITQCTRGPISPWTLAVGLGGMYFVNNDGIYRTAGGPEEWLTKKIDPIFRGETKNGMKPIDFTQTTKMRLEIFENEIWFQYQDTDGNGQVIIYSIPFQFWRRFTFAHVTSSIYADEGNANSVLLLGGVSTGKTYQYSGFSDDGTAIDVSFRTGVVDFGRPRLEKRFGDQLLDLDTQGVEITLQNYLNNEGVVNNTDTLDSTTGRKRAVFDVFGTTPQRGYNIATNLSWSSATAAPLIYQLGTTMIVEPDVTVNRVTQWDDLGHPDESYLTGVTFDCDTAAQDRTIIIESDYAGAINTVAVLTVNTNGRHKIKFSWPAAQMHKVRVRPTDDCLAWILYKVDWIAVPEPPRIAGWDTYFENGWDNYYTGVDLYCDTSGQDKTVEFYVDGNLVKTETINRNGRKVQHVTIPWGRGHVFHLVATDDNPGILYDVRWQVQPEPSEQTNWNQNFTIAGGGNDKFLKAIIFECDTFGEDKLVTVECDGVVVETLTVNADGRKVVQLSFPQHLGRVFRIYPTDDFPGRLYSLQWVFDSEPFALARWETQEITHGIDSWHYPIWAHVALKSTADVNMQVIAYNQVGTQTVNNYTITSTGGNKIKAFVPFQPTKGILYKYIITSAESLYLYREETTVYVREWGTDRTATVHPFGNDDTDQTRGMINSALAESRQGGGTGA